MLDLLKSHKITILILFLVVVVLGVVTYSFTAPQGIFSGLSNDLKVIENKEGTTYTDLDGTPVSLLDYKGTPLIINAWASWIPFSQEELKLLAKIKNTYGDSIVVLAINRKEDIPTIKAYLDFIGKQEGIIFLNDPSDNFYKAVQGYAMPETVFYNADGVIVSHKRGVLTEAELDSFASVLVQNK